jgi:hypothetical protein
MWIFLFTTSGALLDMLAMLVIWRKCKWCYNRGCSIRCPLREPDEVTVNR